MFDYLKAYQERLDRNHDEFLRMAGELKARGCKVDTYASEERYISSIRVEKDGRQCHFGFTDVPYRWYIDISWKPNEKTGSGKTVLTKTGGENKITPEEIIAHMAPKYEHPADKNRYREL